MNFFPNVGENLNICVQDPVIQCSKKVSSGSFLFLFSSVSHSQVSMLVIVLGLPRFPKQLGNFVSVSPSP